MAGYDRKIDPVTRDYVDNDDANGFELVSNISTSLYHDLQTELNSWWGDETAGSALFQVFRMGLNSETLAFARLSVKAVLEKYVRIGLATDPFVDVEAVPGGRFRLLARLTDVTGAIINVAELVALSEGDV